MKGLRRMKIVCDACTAKYSIADEKVAGKVFKIRCKKCENIIVVRGNTAEAVEAAPPANKATKVFDYDSPDAALPAEGEWHVVIDQEQVGPMTSEEVRQRFANGEIDADSYIWKEGFADWERIPDVAEFADLEAAAAPQAPSASDAMFGTPEQEPAAEPGPVAAVAAAAAAVPRSGADIFGGDAGGVDLFGGEAESDSGSNLFGNADPSIGDNTGEISMSKEAEAQLKGQRNENSVLFSLGNLAALASDAPKAAPSSSSSAPGISNTGGSEGSGLIDIRSMASVYLADKGGSSATGSAGVGSVDDLPVFNTSGFESASPVLLPTQSAGNDNKVVILLGIIGALVVAAAILIFIVLKGGDEDKAGETKAVASAEIDAGTGKANPADVPAETDTTEVPAEATPTETVTPPVTDVAPEKPTPTTESAKPAPAASKPKPEKKLTRREKRELAKREKEKRAQAKRDAADKRKAAAAAKRESPNTGGGGGCDEITCLVEPNKACCRKLAKKKPSSSTSGGGNSNLPEKLSRGDISAGISKVKGRVSSCGDKHDGKGRVSVSIKINGAGKVTSASASGGSSGLRSCVTSAVKRARFKKTQKGMSVKYPFVFR